MFILNFAIFMALFGLIMIFNASVYVANNDFGDQFHFVKLQAIWLLVGLIPSLIIYFLGYKFIAKLALPALGLAVILLIAVLALGDDVNGSKRWFAIGEIPIQPAELLKPALILYFGAWLSKEITQDVRKVKVKSFFDLLNYEIVRRTIVFLIVLGIVLILVLVEPDLGTTMVVGLTAVIMFFLSSNDRYHYIASLSVVSLLGLLGILAGILEKYRFLRILTFVDLLLTGEVVDKINSGYQMNQILIAIGSGGFWGRGFGQSILKNGYLVENTAFTDSIIVVILEELGVLGGLLILLGWLFFFWKGMQISQNAPDRIGQLLAAGVTIWLVIQAFMNIAANVGLMPLTGIPLPLLSYGGSSTIVTMMGIAILLSVSKFSNTQR